jgi:hypothetical protein
MAGGPKQNMEQRLCWTLRATAADLQWLVS